MGGGGVQSTQEPQLSLDWSHLSSEMACMTHGDYEGDLDDSLMDRPKTPIRQYLIDVIGEQNVCELEAVDGKDEETDDEFRQACAVMSETDTDFVSSNLGTNKKENSGQLSLGQTQGEQIMSSAEKKQPSVGVSDASVSRKETKQSSETVKETGTSSSPKKKKQSTKTTTKSSNKTQGKSNISHQDRLRLGVERIKQSSTYWKEEPVEDPRLTGWCLHLCKRASGHLDKYWFTPAGIKLRSKPEVEKFLLALQDANGDEDEAYTLLSKNRKRRSVGAGGAAPKSTNNTTSGTDSSAKETASTGALSTQRQKKTKKSEKTSQEQTATATKTTNATVTTPTRSSSRKKKIPTAMTTEDGIDYSMTSAVQSVSASKKRNVRRKERVIKHTSAAKDAKRVRSATVTAVLQQQKSKYATVYERDQIHAYDSFVNTNAAQSIVFKRIQRMKHNSNHTGPYRLHYKDANITDQFAEPKFIEVKKATKKKAAKGLQVFSPVSKFDIPAVAESK